MNHLPAGRLASGADPVRLDRGSVGWNYCGLHVVALEPGESRTIDLDGVEAAVVPLQGSCSLSSRSLNAELAGRDSVFDGVPDVAFVPPDGTLTLTSTDGGRFAVATATAEEQRDGFVLPAAEVGSSLRGAGPATRRINGLLSADVAGPQRLIVVEVITPGGNWSSYPPHKHDEWSDTEVPIEEIYYFEITGENGFGFHRTYTADGMVDDTLTVHDGDVYVIPRGYHGPCAAAPGYDMYYLNVMAGPDPERRWLICNDPAHAWVLDTWPGMDPDPRLIERQ